MQVQVLRYLTNVFLDNGVHAAYDGFGDAQQGALRAAVARLGTKQI
ncbi:hypothetical protein OK016_08870 [Vibrio chagasii]|nr:hypothetical protein [Vibrio chagasii]